MTPQDRKGANKMKKRYTSPEIIATHLCCDYNDVKSAIYQPSLFNIVSVYTLGDDYYCCPTFGKLPPRKDKNGFPGFFVWLPVFTHKQTGRTVYMSRLADMREEQ